MSKPIPYPKEAQDFLNGFYKGETDPEKKLEMLRSVLEEFPGQNAFYATTVKENGFGSLYDNEVPIDKKIACFEYELLENQGLIQQTPC